MTLYEETVRLADERVSNYLERRRNILACAVEQGIEACLEGGTHDGPDIRVPPGTDPAEIADAIRNEQEVPRWAQPLVMFLREGHAESW
jgi:hypothetical protein